MARNEERNPSYSSAFEDNPDLFEENDDSEDVDLDGSYISPGDLYQEYKRRGDMIAADYRLSEDVRIQRQQMNQEAYDAEFARRFPPPTED